MPWKRNTVSDLDMDSDGGDSDWRDWPALIRKCLVEFVGLILFVFVGSLSFQAGGNLVVPALAHGVTIFILISAFGHISGGHFNPAVTLGVLISGGIHAVPAILYVLSQLLGAFVGGLFVRAALLSDDYLRISGGTTNMNEAISYEGMALLTEAFITYILVNAVLMTAVDTTHNPLAPLAIGLSVTVGILSGGPNSGGSMNPARSFGPACSYAMLANYDCTGCGVTPRRMWRFHWIHWVGPLLGAAVAALLYRLFFGRSSKRWLFR